MSRMKIQWVSGAATLALASSALGQTAGPPAGQTPANSVGSSAVSVGGGGSAPPPGEGCVVLAGQRRAPSTDVLSLEVGTTYTDNLLLSSVNPLSQTVADAGVRYDKSENGPRFCADVSADLHFFDYLRTSFPKQVVGGASGAVNFAIVPDHLIWLLQDNFGQIALNPEEVSTPLNRQNFNYLATGPRLTLPLSSSMSLSARAFYEQTYFQYTDTNTRGTTEALSLAKHVSNRDTVSLETSASHVEYTDLPLGLAYNDYEVYARYMVGSFPVGQAQNQGRGGVAITADLGESSLHFAGTSENGLLARLSISSPIGAFSNVALNAGRQFSDTAGVFVLDQTTGGIVIGNDTAAAAANSPFQLEYGYLSWQTSRLRTSLTISANWNKESYQSTSPLDLTQYGTSVGLTRLITARVMGDISIAWSRQQYAGSGTELIQRTFGGGVTWKYARRWAFAAHAYHVSGGAPFAQSGVGSTGGDYRGNSIYSTLTYTLAGR